MEEEPTKIKIVTKKAYGIFQKLFCCRCFHCLQADDESMLTSDIRKQTFQRMIKNFAIESNVLRVVRVVRRQVAVRPAEADDNDIPV